MEIMYQLEKNVKYISPTIENPYNKAICQRYVTIISYIFFFFTGQWGTPTVKVASVFGMLAGVLASMLESVGDYYACAKLSGAPPPPKHALNRGLGCEGLGCLITGAWGTGNGTTSYSENISAIGITRVSESIIDYIQYNG